MTSTHVRCSTNENINFKLTGSYKLMFGKTHNRFIDNYNLQVHLTNIWLRKAVHADK